jgi:hypothetical protein
MSTKIWVAYRLRKNGDLWEVVHDIKTKATNNARAVIRKMHKESLATFDYNDPVYRKYLKDVGVKESSRYYQLAWLHQQMYTAFRAQLNTYSRNGHDFESWVWVREYKKVVSLIPRSDMLMKNIFKFMAKDPRLTDWHYQNQVSPDPAEEADPKDWARRKRYYNGIDDSGRWKSYLLLSICDRDNFGDIDPWMEMMKEA